MLTAQEITELSEQITPLDGFIGVEGINLTSLEAYTIQGREIISRQASGKISPFAKDEASIDENTIGGLASITKIITSAGLLKLYDNQLTAKKIHGGSLPEGQTEYFPQGMQTKLSSLMPALKEKFPDTKYLAVIEQIEQKRKDEKPDYQGVTLEDLLNHTHGFGNKDAANLAVQIMKNPTRRFECHEVLDYTDPKSAGEYGKFSYSNVGFELAGMIMELVTNKKYDRVIEEQIIKPIGAEGQIFTQSRTNTEIPANQLAGFAFLTPCLINGEFHSGQMNCDTSCDTKAAGGLKSSPLGIAKFTEKFLAPNLSDSLFANQETLNALWKNEKIPGKHNLCGVFQYPDGTFGHNGDGASHETSLRYDPEKKIIYFYRGNGETLTPAIAREIVKLEHDLSKLSDDTQDKLIKQKIGELKEKGYDFSKILQEFDTSKAQKESQGQEFTDQDFKLFAKGLAEKIKAKEEVSTKSFLGRLREERTRSNYGQKR